MAKYETVCEMSSDVMDITFDLELINFVLSNSVMDNYDNADQERSCIYSAHMLLTDVLRKLDAIAGGEKPKSRGSEV